MSHEDLKQELIKYGKKLVEVGLTKGTGGNLSVYIPSEEKMLITPSGIDFFDIKEEDIVTMKLDGTIFLSVNSLNG